MPNEGDVLLLGKLGRAVGANGDYTSLTLLAEDGRGVQGTLTKMSQFDASYLANMTLNPDQNNEGTFLATMNFSSGYGSLFLTRIADRKENFTWSETGDGFGLVYIDSANEDYTATWNINSGYPGQDDITITGKFYEDGQSDGFNDHVTNYNTNLTDVFTYDDPS